MPEAKSHTLVLVHPGSLCGSATSALGRWEASCAREAVLDEVSQHEGNLIVIDGFLSDELSYEENHLINEALTLQKQGGHTAMRIWGCDAGEDPFPGWKGCGEGDLIFDGQSEAAISISNKIAETVIEVTGAWAREDLSSGCATSVLMALRELLPGDAVDFSDTVLHEPDDEPESDMTFEST